MTTLMKRGNRFIEFIQNMFPIDAAYSKTVFKPLISTVQMSVAGTVIGAALALFTAFLSAANVMELKLVRLGIKLVVQIIRTVPVLILALISTFAWGIGTFAGTFALGIYSWAILTRMGSEDIESMSVKAFDALSESGAGRAKAFVRTILVEFLPGYINNALYLLETNVRHASILGYVGAGGIGLLLNEKVAWREYEKVGTILTGLFIAVLIIEGISLLLSHILSGQLRINKYCRIIIWTIAVTLCVWSVGSVGKPDMSALGMKVVGSIIYGITHPDWSYFLLAGKSGVLFLLLETLCIAVAGTLLGAMLAAVLAILGSKRFMPLPAALTARIVLMAIRTIPVLIYGIMFLRVTGPGSFAGVLTLTVTSVGLIAKRFMVAIDHMDMSSWEAYKAYGAGVAARIKYCMLPQLLPEFVSAVLYRFDVNLRSASILGLVGAGGIGAPLIMYMNQYRWDAVGAILIALFLLVLAIELASALVRRKK